MISVKIEGLDRLQRSTTGIGRFLSPMALEAEVMLISKMAGEALLAASVRACIEAIYDLPEQTYDRTMALLDAHRVRAVAEGPVIFEQHVEIDPEWSAEGSDSPRANRDYVGADILDYAQHVHDGYVQWVWGHNTGIFVEGKAWFEVALVESYPVIVGYVRRAFFNCIERAMREATL